MRIASTLIVTSLLISGAHAADYLRGAIPSEPPRAAPSPSYDWSGFYAGAQVGYQAMKTDHSKIGTNLTAATFPGIEPSQLSASLLTFGSAEAKGRAYGFFAGYNTMWDDVVIGGEFEYNRPSLIASQYVGPFAHRTASKSTTGNLWDTAIDGTAQTAIDDYAVGKIRVGVAYDRFMPFVTAGVAVARMTTRANSLGATQEYQLQPITDPVTNAITGYNRINITGVIVGNGQTKTSGIQWGYAFGAGMDVAVTDAIFLRGSWEYLGFGGDKASRTSLNTVKGGAGVKF